MLSHNQSVLGEDIETILHRAAEIASSWLQTSADPEARVSTHTTPEIIRSQINVDPPEEGRDIEELMDEVRKALDLSVKTGHPAWCNQLFGGYDLAAIVGDWITTVMNTTMATYEAAPVATTLEHAIVQKLLALAGFDGGEGILTPGGSISNLMALLAARHRTFPHVQRVGFRAGERPAVFTSSASHYSIERAARIAGLGSDCVIPIEIDSAGCLIPEKLEEAIESAKDNGMTPMFVCATAGTTVYGAYDPIEKISSIAQAHGAWLHVDGAYGASVLLSSRHRGLMYGIEQADSLTWCPHKMMGIPLICSAILIKERSWLAACHSTGAGYLFHQEEDAVYDMGEMSIQCGRRVDSIKLWLAWQHHGDKGYEERIDALFDQARLFADMVREREGFRLVRVPESFNVLFHYLPENRRDPEPSLDQIDELTKRLRERVKQRGRVMVNYAPVDDISTFRMILSNPRATEEDLAVYLDEIEAAGEDLAAASSAQRSQA